MRPSLVRFAETLYSIPQHDIVRDRPLEVLALGLSRFGTDSLRNALSQLGYTNIHHGFKFLVQGDRIIPWIHLAYKQEEGTTISAAEFDKVLGNFDATTDLSAAEFAHELIAAYPDAKVIINYREDVEAWHHSVSETLNVAFDSWLLLTASWFEAHLFWQREAYWCFRHLPLQDPYSTGDGRVGTQTPHFSMNFSMIMSVFSK